ncbi:MAG TPA: hypothetical protein VGH38_27595 [Bryobacteraceae bacterium]
MTTFEYAYIDQEPAQLKIAVPGHEAEQPHGLKGPNDVLLDVLNECGRDGWELVATHISRVGGPTLWLKRGDPA